MGSNFDTNVSNYTLSELMAITEIDDLDPHEITKKTNSLIDKFKISKPQLSVFFREVQSQLLQYSIDLLNEDNDDEIDDVEPSKKIYVEGFGNMSNEAKYPIGDKQVTEWYQNENLQQEDTNQVNKITNRKQKIGIFGDSHAPMKREQLGINDTFQVSVKQDSLNPNLKNTITRFINLDSQFRQYTSGIESTSTDYTLDLSDTLKDTLSIRLYSYQIPYNWYVIDSAYGNTCFWVTDTSYNIPVYISPGNYTPDNFKTSLITSFTNAGFSFPAPPVSYNPNNGKITLSLYDGSFNGIVDSVAVSFIITASTKITFYDFTGILQCNTNCISKSNYYLNNTLGWIMGYRMPYIFVDPSGNQAPSILDLNGSKYLILVIDDYNQNHVNNGLVSITQLSNKLKLPNYYSPDLPYTCLNPGQQVSNLSDIMSGQTSNGLLVAGKYEGDFSPTQIVLPSAPRILTQSQIYTINEINKNRNNNTNYLSKAPTSPDILAIIPIKPSGVSTGTLLVEFSGSLQDNIRTYFGPVDIDRMCVKLLDDKGNVLNLNGTDWCVTLICECLYQY
jgi:hypothetical protein